MELVDTGEVKVERAKGFEPSTEKSQPPEAQSPPPSTSPPCAQIRAQIPDASFRDLARVVASWPELSAPIRAAVLALVDTSLAQKGGAQ